MPRSLIQLPQLTYSSRPGGLRGINPAGDLDLWTPAGMNTSLWLDAAEPATVVLTSGKVSQWSDKSGNGRDFTQANSNYQPNYVSNGTNGRPHVEFDGSNDLLQRVSEAWAYSYPHSAFIVFDWAASGTNYNSLFETYQEVVGTYGGWVILIKNNQKSAVYATAPGYQYNYDGTGSATYAFNTPQLINVEARDYSLKSYRNAVLDGSYSTIYPLLNTVYPTGYISLGSSSLFNRYTAFKLAEVIIMPPPSSHDRAIIEGYLAHKWGFDKLLPLSHPYKFMPPFTRPQFATAFGASGYNWWYGHVNRSMNC